MPGRWWRSTPDGKAVPATAAGTVCAGVAQHQAAAGEPVLVRRGVFNFEDGADDAALTRADIGATAYVADDQTVKKAAGTPAASVAGIGCGCGRRGRLGKDLR